MLNYSNNTDKDNQESKNHLKSYHLAITANIPLKTIFPHGSLCFYTDTRIHTQSLHYTCNILLRLLFFLFFKLGKVHCFLV